MPSPTPVRPDLRGKSSANPYKASRLRIHEACRRPGDESLGFSAPTSTQGRPTRCDRCQEPLGAFAAVVQTFPEPPKRRAPAVPAVPAVPPLAQHRTSPGELSPVS